MTVKYRLLVTVGDNAERIRNEAAFAKHCGVAPPVRQQRKNYGQARLSRGGDRAVNSALCIVTIARMRHNEATRAYVERRTAEELSKRETIRCRERYSAREIYVDLPRPAPTSGTSRRRSRVSEGRTYHRRRRQDALGRLTPFEYGTIMNQTVALAA